MISYNPFNWYWFVEGDTTQVFSTTADAYVPADDATYQAWVATNPEFDPTTRIDTEANLAIAVEQFGIIPTFP